MRGLLVQSAAELLQLAPVELVPSQMKRGRDSVNDGDRRLELVGGDRDEVALHAVDVAELVQRVLELLVAVRLVDEDGRHPAERREQLELVGTEFELAAGVVEDQEAEAARLDTERYGDDRADAEALPDLVRHRRLRLCVADEERPPLDESALEERKLVDPEPLLAGPGDVLLDDREHRPLFWVVADEHGALESEQLPYLGTDPVEQCTDVVGRSPHGSSELVEGAKLRRKPGRLRSIDATAPQAAAVQGGGGPRGGGSSSTYVRSEERRVGKEGRSRWSPDP